MAITDQPSRALRAVPAWAWLTLLVVASAAFRAVVSLGMTGPFIMVDELVYAELARSFADAGEFLVRDVPSAGYGIVYPLLLSPVYAAFHSLPDAYRAALVVNSALMSLAAIPAYALARRVVGSGLALLVAVLTVAAPSLVYTGTVMTENVFYPIFLAVSLLLVVTLEKPTALRQLLLLAAIVVAYLTRAQAIAFVPAVLLAPLALAAIGGGGVRSTLRSFRVLYGAVVGAAAALVAVQLVRGESLRDLLGAYDDVSETGYDVGEVLRYLVYHLAELDLYLLAAPFAATVVLLWRSRSHDRSLQALLAATASIFACFVLVVATFASKFAGRIEERNLFVVAPLFLVLLVAWVDRGAPRPRVLAPLAAVGSALLVLAIPFDRFLDVSAISDTLMLLPLWSLEDRLGESWTPWIALAVTGVMAALFLLVPSRRALVVPLVLLALWAVALKPIQWGTHGFERASRGAVFQGIRAPERDWIDRALPDGAEAAMLWTGLVDQDRFTVNQNEFFSRGVGPIYYLDTATPGQLPETRVRLHPRTGLVTLSDGTPLRPAYAILDSTIEPDGEALARDDGWGLTLWRLDGPLASTVRVDGLYPHDTWSGPVVTYVKRRCRPGSVHVDVWSDPGLFVEPQLVTVRTRGRHVGSVGLAPEGRASLDVRVTPPAGSDRCVVRFVVTPTAIPARVTGGGNPDRRVLGAHFSGFRFTPAPEG